MNRYFSQSFTQIRSKSSKGTPKVELNTLKSKHDEQRNQDLLKRLQNISVIGGRRLAKPPEPVIQEDVTKLPPRSLTMEKLKKLTRFYHTDPLVWNPSVLGRIFNLPEYYCENIAFYVRPMVYFANSEYDDVQRLIQTSYVVDVGRMKTDDNYLVNYKKIVFPESKEKLPLRALPELAQVEEILTH